jgi:carboxypeptidase D
LFPELLNSIKIYLYVGQYDYVCNSVGIESTISNLIWGGSKGWPNGSKEESMYLNSTLVGTVQRGKNLTYALLHDASHMAPFDAPAVTFQFIAQSIGIESTTTTPIEKVRYLYHSCA